MRDAERLVKGKRAKKIERQRQKQGEERARRGVRDR